MSYYTLQTRVQLYRVIHHPSKTMFIKRILDDRTGYSHDSLIKSAIKTYVTRTETKMMHQHDKDNIKHIMRVGLHRSKTPYKTYHEDWIWDHLSILNEEEARIMVENEYKHWTDQGYWVLNTQGVDPDLITACRNQLNRK